MEEDAEETLRAARTQAAKWVVLDGYHFELSYQRYLRRKGVRILVVDDHAHLDRYEADVFLNQNVITSSELHPIVNDDCRVLLGPKYALLRGEFSDNAPPERDFSRAGRILVTFGGGDSENVSLEILRALEDIGSSPLHVSLVLGSANPHVDAVRRASAASCHDVEVVVDAQDMRQLMADADVAIGAAGSVCWEIAYMGLPAVIFIVAANQEHIGCQLDSVGAMCCPGWAKSVSRSEITNLVQGLLDDVELRVAMSRRMMRLVDGLGARRVVEIIKGMPS